MGAGKLVLLLLAGGLAGVAFAGITTGSMRPYRQAEAAHHRTRDDTDATDYAAPPAHSSWLEQGLSLLDNPAWPFGRGAAGEHAIAPEDDTPYGYVSRDGDDRAPASGDRAYPDNAYAAEGESGGDPALDLPPEHAVSEPRQQDSASDAARRAADAANDVIAAEHAN